MEIFVVGLNHRTAPVALREKLAFDAPAAARALDEIRTRFPRAEAVVLSTCNRVEVYIARPRHDGPDAEAISAFLCEFHGLPPAEPAACLYRREGEEAIKHLFLVAGGLDSMVLGESQIIGQVKEAWSAAALRQSVGKVFNRLFRTAFETAKEIHSETAVGQGKVSVGSAAVEMVREIFSEFSDKTVLLIGAGKMGELTLRNLVDLGIRRILVCNRSAERGREVAGRFAAEFVPFEELYTALVQADIVLTGTGSREPIIRAAPTQEVVARRHFRTMFVIDIAVPRDVEPAVGDLTNVFLYNIDDLKQIVDRNIEKRRREVERATAVIDRRAGEFLSWFEARDLGPLIGRLQEHVKASCDAELTRLRSRLGGSAAGAEWAAIEESVRKPAARTLHLMIEQLKALARDGDAARVTALAEKMLRGAGDGA
jgi:glutamyl-tRNA reductase